MTARATASVDAAEFRQIFDDNAEFVLRTVQRLGVRPADVDDAAQQVFLVVHRQLHQYDGRCKMRTWIFGIARRVVADYRKRAHRRHEIVTGRCPDLAVQPSQVRRIEHGQRRALLEQALELLDDAKRAVFVLYELEELPMSEVAEAVGCPLQTAYSRLYAARAKVKEHVLSSLRDEEVSS